MLTWTRNMGLMGSAGQGFMLALTIGFSVAIANGVWGFFAPSGRTLEQLTADTFLGGKSPQVV